MPFRPVLLLVVLLLVVLLSGCAADQASREPCVYGAEDAVPVALRDGAPVVPVRLGTGIAQLVPDTGAESTLISPATAARLGLRPDPLRRLTIRGLGGDVPAEQVTAEVGLGRLRVPATRIAVLALPPGFDGTPPPDGLLGADVLALGDLDLDLGAGRLVLHPQRRGCAPEAAPPDGTGQLLPTQRRRERFIVPVLFDGRPVRALLDTGAGRSLLTEAAARRLGIGAEQLAAAPAGQRRGVDGVTRPVRRIRFAQMQVGPDTFRDVEISVGPALLERGVDMLLGADWARGRRVWISYASGQVFVAPSAAGPRVAGGLGEPARPAPEEEAPRGAGGTGALVSDPVPIGAAR